jgi:drug/metabolite transporter (DMT)-like permease
MPTDAPAGSSKSVEAAHAVPASVTLSGFGFLLLASLIWGVNWPVTKFLLSELPPLSARGVGGVVGAAITFAAAAVRHETLVPPAGQWRRLIAAAGLNFTAYLGFTTLSLLWLRASEAAIIAYTLPIWASALAWPLLGERPSLARSTGMLLGLSGVVLLLAAEPPVDAWAKIPGVLLALAAAVLFALGTVQAKRAPLGMPPVAGVAWQAGIGTLPLLLAGLLVEDPHFGAIDTAGWLALGYSGALAFGLAYITWFRALRLMPASLATIGSLLVPAIGVVASALMLGEPLGLREIGALGLTLSGVVLAARG